MRVSATRRRNAGVRRRRRRRRAGKATSSCYGLSLQSGRGRGERSLRGHGHYSHDRARAAPHHAGRGRLELARTQEVVRRHLPAGRLRILDVGGARGRPCRAGWRPTATTSSSSTAVPLHVEQARAAGRGRCTVPLPSVGDARRLEHPDGTFDVVLLLGPLYHLTEVDDRVRALAEARRVVRDGGVVFAAAISRFASLFDGLARGFLFDPEFRADGRSRPARTASTATPPNGPAGSRPSYFHRPDELEAEAGAAASRSESWSASKGWPVGCLGSRPAGTTPETARRSFTRHASSSASRCCAASAVISC